MAAVSLPSGPVRNEYILKKIKVALLEIQLPFGILAIILFLKVYNPFVSQLSVPEMCLFHEEKKE